MKHSADPATLGIYLHWPFCTSKCPYCDFNSHVAARIEEDDWLAAYRAELQRAAVETPGRRIASIFFGGGTPSLMSERLVDGVLAEIRRLWPLANDVEITLEANPGSVEAARFAGYRAAGVNRVSIGIQSLREPDLRRLGRMHSLPEARAALDLALATFPRVSFDLIYGRQDQTPANWQAELAEALATGVRHLSLYCLTIEPGTVFGERYRRGLLPGLPDEDRAADLFDLTRAMCREAGLPAYEVSNHAAPGEESRHNMLYWTAGDWLGIGPGAHGRLTLDGRRIATDTPRNPAAWLNAVKHGTGELPREFLGRLEQAQEYLVMGLRLEEGIDLDRLAAILGHAPDPAPWQELAASGHLLLTDTRAKATEIGVPLLNTLINRLAESLSAA